MKFRVKLAMGLMVLSSLYLHSTATVFAVVFCGLYIMKAIEEWGFND